MKWNTSLKEAKKDTLTLNTIGAYKFEIKNKNKGYIVLDLALALTNCHSLKHKLKKEDLIIFSNRFNEGLAT